MVTARHDRKRTAAQIIRRAALLFSLVLAVAEFCPSPAAAADSVIEKSRKFLLQGDYKAAGKTLEARLKTAPEDAEAHLALAQLFLIEEQKLDDAIEHAEAAVHLDGGSSRYYRWLALALAMKVKVCDRVEDAVEPARRGFQATERALTLDPANDEARGEAVQFYIIAPDALGGDVDKALAHARILAEKGIAWGQVMVARCIAVKEGRFDKGAEYLRALALTDTTKQAAHALARFLYVTKDYAESAAACRALLEKDPDDAAAQFDLGKALAGIGQDLETAMACFQRVLASPPLPGPYEPTPAGAHCRLGMIYDRQGKRDLALAELRQAVRLEPEQLMNRQELRKVLAGEK